jgi:hypothetical protein
MTQHFKLAQLGKAGDIAAQQTGRDYVLDSARFGRP